MKYIVDKMNYNYYAEYQTAFFIAVSSEMNYIQQSCDKRFGSKMKAGWTRIKNYFFVAGESNESVKDKWVKWYAAATKIGADGKRKKQKDIDWFGNPLSEFWKMLRSILCHFGLLLEIQCKVKWADCPVKAICRFHLMTEEDMNIARTQYPFHKNLKPDEYEKTKGVYHCCCRIHKQQVHGGTCHVYKTSHRVREHLFRKSKHMMYYHYVEAMMLSVASFILKKTTNIMMILMKIIMYLK